MRFTFFRNLDLSYVLFMPHELAIVPECEEVSSQLDLEILHGFGAL